MRQPAGAASHPDGSGRSGGAASRRRPADPGPDPVRDVPGGVLLGAADHGADLRWLRGPRRLRPGQHAGRAAAELSAERRDLRRRQRPRVPAADHHHLPVHPAVGRPRLHGARRVPDGSHHGRRRAARPCLHSAAVELRLRDPRDHGDARDRQPPRPPHHHPDRAADDLLGAHPGLYADHLGLRAGQGGVRLDQSARGW